VILHHFTSELHLAGIAAHGLTVGDVPTDIRRNISKVGVWLTSADTPTGHGLEESAANKKRFRLSVELPDNAPQLVRWLDWAMANVTRATITALHDAAADSRPETWFVYFGVIPVSCTVRPYRVIARKDGDRGFGCGSALPPITQPAGPNGGRSARAGWRGAG
jgi:hypothetical protein